MYAHRMILYTEKKKSVPWSQRISDLFCKCFFSLYLLQFEEWNMFDILLSVSYQMSV